MFKGGLLPQKSRILRWHSLGTRYTFRMAGPVCRSVGLETTGYGNEEKKEHVITQGGGPIMQRQRFFFSTDLSRSGGGKEEICMGLNLEKGKTVERSGEERKGERFNCPWENGGWRKEGTYSRPISILLFQTSYIFHRALPTTIKNPFRRFKLPSNGRLREQLPGKIHSSLWIWKSSLYMCIYIYM